MHELWVSRESTEDYQVVQSDKEEGFIEVFHEKLEAIFEYSLEVEVNDVEDGAVNENLNLIPWVIVQDKG